jgi:type I restriction enzyme S subunit
MKTKMKNNTPTLPAGWKMVALGDVAKVITGSTPKSSIEKYYGGKILWAGPTDLDVEKYVYSTNKTITESGVKEGKARIIPKNSTMLCCIGATLGRCAIATEDMATNQQINSFVPDEKLINSEFLFYSIKTFNDDFKKNSSTTTLPIINKTRCAQIEIPLPPLETQKKIVAKLAESQNRLDEALVSLEKAEKRLESVMASALRKLIPDDESELPEGWEMVELQDVVSFDKKTVTPIKGEKYNYLSLENINAETGEISELPLVDGEEIKSSKNSFYSGQILYSKLRPYLNKVVIARENGICVTDIIPLTLKQNISKDYLWFYLRSHRIIEYVKFHMAGIRMPRLRTKEFKEMPVVLPPLPEQEKIIARLAQIKEQVHLARSLYNEALARTEEIQQSLLQKAFRGELVLETAPAKEEKIDWFKLKQVIGAIIRNLGTNASLRGEMVLAKYTFFVQELFGVHIGLQFQKHNFGPYSPAIKKAILGSAFNKDKFFRVQGKGVQQVYALGQNSAKLFQYQNAELTQAESTMNTLSEVIGNMPSDKVELLATICKIIQDSGSIDPETIWQEMQNWETEGRSGERKVDIFDQDSTLRCLEFIKSKQWDKKLLQK